MPTPIGDLLELMCNEACIDSHGELASYIPQLAHVDPSLLAVALCTTTGHLYSSGDDDYEFSIQSISKPFTYALALTERGFGLVNNTIGVEPSGEAFNELSLEKSTHRPMNPMINAGAIATNQLISSAEAPVSERVEHIRAFFSQLAGRELRVDYELADSEFGAADRNFALAHMLRSYGIISASAHDAVRSYVEQCSILVTVRDLAVMAATLASGGENPLTGKAVISPRVSRRVQAVMAAAGMYDRAGKWMTEVGLPAKSGVSGGVIGTLPSQLGLAAFSPRLDSAGNSIRAIDIFERLSRDLSLHLMDTHSQEQMTIRSIRSNTSETTFVVQGAIRFIQVEEFIHEVELTEISTETVVIDLSRVAYFNKIGRRLFERALRSLNAEGKSIAIIDPDNRLPDIENSAGVHVEVRSGEHG